MTGMMVSFDRIDDSLWLLLTVLRARLIVPIARFRRILLSRNSFARTAGYEMRWDSPLPFVPCPLSVVVVKRTTIATELRSPSPKKNRATLA